MIGEVGEVKEGMISKEGFLPLGKFGAQEVIAP
jgi:hypothetical protein